MALAKNIIRDPLKKCGSHVGVYTEITPESRAIIMLCKTDQDCSIVIEHSIDKKDVDYTDIFRIRANIGSSFDIPIRGRFYRITLKNETNDDQTYLRCQWFLSESQYVFSRTQNFAEMLFDGTEIAEETYSKSVGLDIFKNITIFGTSKSKAIINVQASMDNQKWYNTNVSIITNNEDFYYTFDFNCSYMRLKVRPIKEKERAIIDACVCAKIT